ncbi:MAG: glycosyltransferase [Anaerolineae bacterium]|nr:glycosyltransferase [Anaerolineae bacterium]
MTRILIVGFAPLPVEHLRMSAPSLRTWQFTKILLDAGHEVCLIANRGHSIYPADLPEVMTQRNGNLLYHNVSNQAFDTPELLLPLVNTFNPQCAIGANTPGSAAAVPIIGEIPLWADMNGSIMAEAQMKAQVYGDDSYLAHFWALERTCLARADVFSTVAERQKWSLVGELGVFGRLNQWTSGYEFVHPLRVAIETTPYEMTRRIVRGVIAPQDAFIILYTGGYNTWVDIDILFAALERVMEQHPQVWFVSTGGTIDGHDDITYARFKNMIRTSRFGERFQLQGWVPADDLPSYYLDADVGLSTDKLSYEGLLGSRNRALDWLRAGLPAVLSDLPELAQEIRAAGAGLTYSPGDLEGLVAALETLITQPVVREQMRGCARELLLRNHTFKATAIPALVNWVADPQRAPDHGQEVLPLLDTPNSMATLSAPISNEHFRSHQRLIIGVWRKLYSLLVKIGVRPAVLHRLRHLGRNVFGMGVVSYALSYDSYSVPNKMVVGQSVTGNVVVTNRGRLTWRTPREDTHATNLSYHWLTASGVMVEKEGIRTPLPHSIGPGQQVSLDVRISAPSKPGRYRLEIDAVREGVVWMSEAGIPPLTVDVEVNDAP